MTPVTAELLSVLMPECSSVADQFVDPFNHAFERFGIDTHNRQASFLAQAGHESIRLLVLTEILNYSVKGLQRVFPQYFTPEQALEYAHKPLRIASRVYAGRRGNRDEASGDGWTYRGRGLFPIKGVANYRKCGEAIAGDLEFFVRYPDRLATAEWAVQAAGWIWVINGCNELADEDTETSFRRITRHINGGLHGIHDRLYLWKVAKALLEVQEGWTPLESSDLKKT